MPDYRSNKVRTNNDDSSRQMLRTVKILDVGCGTGENFSWLSKFGEVVGADTSELAIELANQKGRAVLGRAPAFAGRAEDLPFEDNTFNLITAFDVLEHLPDETRVLKEWGRVLCSGGYLFLSVPAYQWLYGPHDRALQHLRRYNLSQLKKILQNNGFHIIFASYFFCLTFPAFLAQRWLVKFSQNDTSQYVGVAPWLNSFLIALGKAESAWLKFGQFPFGSSIVILARKID
ncbi:MAG: Methyltransferase type 11 [candidate division Kazan bacterium GW2011_GWB1_45_10]|uniref:Methyltransferase type 11 n=1 Tax=candidate division Kazan bacterium GW2011_GWB1_45_10 TaxID=1620411 RepID=A0A0G1KTS5_UNCK3|nr:MAG: Methyltransferase type 11 [candidate division Kazan bacterium GW2011_GWB1_45_10]